VKEEHKESDGDPAIKQRIRQLRMERSRNRMMQNIPTATVVITNPTHYSVALAYDHETMDAPRVVAKGQDHLALLIRERAKQFDIPIIENAPIARSLYSRVDLDKEIPEDTYRAVADIIRFVQELKNQRF
jgi:flagellar biosynthetic protein FlhB